MSLTDDKLRQLDEQIEFLADEQQSLRRRHETWAMNKADKLAKVQESLVDYRRQVLKGTML